MTSILNSDIKLLAASRMDDSDYSGGYPSYAELLDNVDNNLFPDVASGDRIAGRTHLRKFSASVRNLDDEPLLAARVYLSLPPNDAAVSVCLLDTQGHASETRENALETLYTAAQQSLNTGLRLFQTYFQGETILSAYWISGQTPALYRIPEQGEIILIEDATNNASQYVRVVSISSSNTSRTASIAITPPLNATFRGQFKSDVDFVTPTQIYTTRSVSMGYGVYGISPLAVAAESGDASVLIESINTAIAPTIFEQIERTLQGSLQRKTLSVPAVNSLLQTATLDPMPDLADIEVYYRNFYGSSVLISGSDSPERFSINGTSITVTLSASPVSISATTRVVADNPLKTITAQTFYTQKILYPGSVSVTARTADGDAVGGTDNGVGVFSGYGGLTGTVDYDDGIIALAFSEAVYLGQLSISYAFYESITYRHQATPSAQTLTFDTFLGPLVDEGSITLTANRFDTGAQITGTDSGGSMSGTGISTGSINYATGRLSVIFSTTVFSASLRVSYTCQRTFSWSLLSGYYPVSSYAADTGGTLYANNVSISATDYETGVVYTARDDGLGAFDNDGITGTVNYATGEVNLSFSSDVIYSSIILSSVAEISNSPIYWRYSAAEDETDFVLSLLNSVVPDSVELTATATSDNDPMVANDNGTGALTGDATGTIDYDSGELVVSFSEEVAVNSLYVTYRTYSYSLVNSLIGGTLDVVRLPESKSYPLVRAGDLAIIHYPVRTLLPNPAVANTTYSLDRENVNRIWVEDAEGTKIPDTQYTVNLSLGSITMASNLDLTDYNQPLSGWTVINDEVLVTSISEVNRIHFTPALTHDYPSESAFLSACVPVGDLGASITPPFSQSAWTSVWQDTVIGNPITAKYDYDSYPIIVTNDGAITERWRIVFASATTVHIIGEHIGQITHSAISITGNIAPINAITDKPYFTIDALGWSAGWIAGNLLRFNTEGADYGIWAIRCTQPSIAPDPGTPDRVRLTLLGDVDA